MTPLHDKQEERREKKKIERGERGGRGGRETQAKAKHIYSFPITYWQPYNGFQRRPTVCLETS